MRSAKTKTKKETAEAGLRMLVSLKRQEGIRGLRGKVKWEGNLDELRGHELPHRDGISIRLKANYGCGQFGCELT
jgi:hypothetical protein